MRRNLFAVLALLALVPAFAWSGEPIRLAESRRTEVKLSMSDAMERVQRATGGRVLQAQTVRVQGREVYRIKVLTRQGEVRVVHVDAETGGME